MTGDGYMEKRVGDLEDWSQKADQRLSDSERRHADAEKRMDDFKVTMQRVWERMDMQRDGQIKTQTLVEVGNKKTDDLTAAFQAFRETEEKRREQERKAAADRQLALELAAKNRTPNWWLVGLTVVTSIIAVASLTLRAVGK